MDVTRLLASRCIFSLGSTALVCFFVDGVLAGVGVETLRVWFFHLRTRFGGGLQLVSALSTAA